MIGRTKEIELLQTAYQSKRAEMVAVIGRRRVGKTYLIRTILETKINFEMVGLKDGTKAQQLRNFTYSLRDAGKRNALDEQPKDWLDAFYQLKEFLEQQSITEKKVVFIDELPWVATPRSDFLTGFSYFWNSYASKNNILVVICGSATAWMIKKIINNRGGLHNRVTQKILLRPFTLGETKAYFTARHINFDYYQTILLYMTMGGIPHYLDQVKKGKSAIQNIDEICFAPDGMLRTEFDNLYSSLFRNPERYESIVEALATTWKGLTRMEILTATSLNDGGQVTTILRELEQSGFITSYTPFNKKKKERLYRLTDNYSLFYLKYIKGIPLNEAGNWNALSQTQSWKSWSGYAFENICLQHIDNIKAALGVTGVFTRQYSFIRKGKDKQVVTQIDFLLDRQDNIINLCEAKFYNDRLKLTVADATNLRRKRTIFQETTQTKKLIFLTLVTTYGLEENQHSLGLIDNVITMSDLF